MTEPKEPVAAPGYKAGLSLHPRSPEQYAMIPRMLELATAFAAELEAVFVQASLMDGSTITVAREPEPGPPRPAEHEQGHR